ncbi:hypothetical protein [Sporomusa sp.]|uniref:hypothetical protein n=1 Tax=Sporomusa sp. TaxID=2078658 RepID=UPI002B8A8214|nr:hypothetical protein [Sporomusa sp.]HWR08531.1 hypothetical protein [Sporomusa sp.]
MFMIECIAHTDVSAELSQQQENFLVTLKTGRAVDICLILNYLQVKVLAKGLLALIAQAKLHELSNTDTNNQLGGMDVTFAINTPENYSKERGEVPYPPSFSVAEHHDATLSTLQAVVPIPGQGSE